MKVRGKSLTTDFVSNVCTYSSSSPRSGDLGSNGSSSKELGCLPPSGSLGPVCSLRR